MLSYKLNLSVSRANQAPANSKVRKTFQLVILAEPQWSRVRGLTKKKDAETWRALKKVPFKKASQINMNEGCSRFLDILHFFDSQAVDFSP